MTDMEREQALAALAALTHPHGRGCCGEPAGAPVHRTPDLIGQRAAAWTAAVAASWAEDAPCVEPWCGHPQGRHREPGDVFFPYVSPGCYDCMNARTFGGCADGQQWHRFAPVPVPPIVW